MMICGAASWRRLARSLVLNGSGSVRGSCFCTKLSSMTNSWSASTLWNQQTTPGYLDIKPNGSLLELKKWTEYPIPFGTPKPGTNQPIARNFTQYFTKHIFFTKLQANFFKNITCPCELPMMQQRVRISQRNCPRREPRHFLFLLLQFNFFFFFAI